MSLWSFLSGRILFDWLFGNEKEKNKHSVPPVDRRKSYCFEDEYSDRRDALQERISRLERKQDRCNICSERYDELQDEIDDLQDELDEIDDLV